MALDFVEIKHKAQGKKFLIFPSFKCIKSNDLMIRGREFYAFWNESKSLWDTSTDHLCAIIDEMLDEYSQNFIGSYEIQYMSSFETGIMTRFNKYCKEMQDNFHDLDAKIIFGNTKLKKTDYASRRLPYPLEKQDISAYDEMIRTLYDKSERQKIEWAIGAVISGDSTSIEKFFVFYGASGTGKSTILKIIANMFDGYTASFRAKDLGNPNNQFAMESLISNPLLAIDYDADLSRIEDNTRLNTIISHETMTINAKYVRSYPMAFRSTLFIGTNSPVRITDSKSGIVRRLIDISPSGRLIARNRYDSLVAKIPFEYPGIAHHCLELYLKLGKTYYDNYKPLTMIDETNDMYNFVADMIWEWDDIEFVSLANAWRSYKDWCSDANITYPLKKRKFKSELKNYFEMFEEHTFKGDNLYSGLLKEKFNIKGEKKEEKARNWITMTEQKSLLDDILADCKAQYATDDEIPRAKWENVKTHLKDIDTSILHYVKPPSNHIVLDFDKKNDKGEKDFLLNLEAASKFPQTYAELSKGGSGIHLHYIWDGDVNELSRIFDDDVEIKVFTGNSSLRRRLTKCNDIPPTTINSGLPLKGKEKSMAIDNRTVENERHLRALIKRCLNKENHGHTKPEVDFIKFLLDNEYEKGVLSYDIRDMRPSILSFAMSSSNQSQVCYDICSSLHYCSKDYEDNDERSNPGSISWQEAPIVFFDVEVFQNVFIICYKKIDIPGEEPKEIVKLINPTPEEVKKLFNFRLVGFNNRRYDNHMIYAWSMGYTNMELYRLSQRIISKSKNAFIGEAYGLSYTDIYDYCSNANKMSLKKWEIKLGIYHLENQYPWDEPLDECHWDEVASYCANDVSATEAVWNATQADFRGRQILAELSGLTVNDTSNSHTQQIIFGNDKHPQDFFNYPDLSKEFPGYKFEKGVSTYMGETVGEGGYVYYDPGMYVNAKCFDVSGMHPHSIKAMNLFGDEYTERYYDLVRIRTYIKHKQYDKVAKMFDGKLERYLGSDDEAKELSNALKTPINSVYGLTAASFMNRCRDPRNIDNVVAKRGALFMVTLKNKVIEMGYKVIHCKTDSIKVANPDEKVERFIFEFGKKYGYDFEVEDIFERICLVNGSTFIAKNAETGEWEAKAAQFAHPYVFKSLFTKEAIIFDDLCETKNVTKGAIYLDMNENRPQLTPEERKEFNKLVKKHDLDSEEETDRYLALLRKECDSHSYHFVGKVGLFTPVLEGAGGGLLVCNTEEHPTKFDAVSGSKGYRWIESGMIQKLGVEDRIDYGYFDALCDDAIDNINHRGNKKGKDYQDFDIFVNGSHEQLRAHLEELNFSGYMEEPEEIPFQ